MKWRNRKELPIKHDTYHIKDTKSGKGLFYFGTKYNKWHWSVPENGQINIHSQVGEEYDFEWLDESEQDEGWVPVERLRQQIIQDLLGNEQLVDKPFLRSGHDSYTRRQLAEEIQNNTEKGMEIISGAIMLAIDLTVRNKVPPATT